MNSIRHQTCSLAAGLPTAPALRVDGEDTDYSDPRARDVLTAEIEEMANDFKDTPGLLMWLLGNENNYGLVWSSAETEDLPEGEANAVRARHMYSLFGDVARSIKEMDPTRPIAMANGDLQYLDIIAEEVPDLDVFGTNVYRGISFGQLFQEVRDKLDRPVMFTEFGADVWNAKDMREDQVTQAKYLIGQWREIYEQSAGKGLVGNSIGGLTFQWSDGWWKFGQESRLDIQDTNASWANGGYVEDFVEGRNNMNEEWWGIVAKGSPDHNRLYELYPRAAYYALQQAYTLDPYAPGTDLAAVRDHFAAMQPAEMGLRALGDRAALLAMQGAAMGLVADGGFTQTQTYTGWTLKDTGSGNQRNLITGFTVLAGNWQIAPNFLWRKPLIGPVPSGVPAPGRPRNILEDPFAVRGNRETRAAEILITYDPTPATWMYNWDSDVREDASFAASLGFVYFNFPTTQDAAIGIFADGRTTFPFPGAPPPRDLWEFKARLVSKRSPAAGMIANIFAGKGEPNGDDERVINRAGLDLRLIGGSARFQGMVRVNDWGPYDYHRDFNLTFPLQLMGDISYSLGPPEWFDLPQTRFGVRATVRSLNEHSPRYCPAMSPDEFGRMACKPNLGSENGREWEVRTYLHIGL